MISPHLDVNMATPDGEESARIRVSIKPPSKAAAPAADSSSSKGNEGGDKKASVHKTSK